MTPEEWRQIEHLYLAVVDLSAAERDAILASAPQDVRTRVEAMLAQPDRSKVLDFPAWQNDSQTLDEPALRPDVQIGQYRIEAEIGGGGMGVVYRALDTKLHRPAAIKFLSQDLADASARRRFELEAQTASSLNHPHILTVYDAGEFDGRHYLVTEYIDGGTLRNWLQIQPRDWEEITELMTGVADALATAHQAGILHRDIKPENILVTKTCYAKLADFGLAKLQEDQAASPTDVQTQQGIIVGTIAYMSPEQASGRPLDARSDMFSFGVVLYEMLAGRHPFRAPDGLERLQRVIHAKPSPLSDNIPEPLRALVMKALEKDPANRFSSMREFVAALRSVRRPSGRRMAAPLPRRKWATAGAAVLLLGLAMAALALLSKRSSSNSQLEYIPLTRFTDSAVAPSISPDGRMLAFIRRTDTFTGRGDVYVKLLPEGDPAQLTHDGGEKMGPLSFSPDGSRIAYTSGESETWSVPVLGGEPTRMLAGTEGLSWTNASPPGVMYSAIMGQGLHMGVFTATESRREERVVYMPTDVNGMAHRSFLSPGGDSVIVVEMSLSGWLPCRVVPFNGSTAGKRAGPAPARCTDAAWTPDGKFMYFSADTGNGFHIWRQRYSEGTPEQVTSGATEEQGISFAPDGKSFVTSVGESQSTLWVHDVGGEHQITFEGYAYLPSFSADGKRMYYLQRSNPTGRFVSGELWTTDLFSGKKQRRLPGLLMEQYDVSPDGKLVIFITADQKGEAPLWIAQADGSAQPQRLVNQFCARAMFAPDGEVYFVGGKRENMFLQRIKPDGSSLQRISSEAAFFLYDISPDGQWLAAWVGRDIRVYPSGGGAPTVVCGDCGSAGAENRGITPPLMSWSRDGKELYLYSEGAEQSYAVPLKPGQVLPAMAASGISWRTARPAIAGIRTIPRQRAFMSGNPTVYAYAEVVAHRNIYKLLVP